MDLKDIPNDVNVPFSDPDYLNTTPPEPRPTHIISDGKLCDPNVQQHSGYINFSGSLGEKSYFFWLLESRSNPSTDPLVIMHFLRVRLCKYMYCTIKLCAFFTRNLFV